MRKIYLVFMVLSMSIGLLKAQTILYDFENLSAGNLNGQDGWVTTQHPFPTAGDMQIMANTGINGDSKALYYGISGANYGADASHALPAGTFANKMQGYEISFDFKPAVWGTTVGIGYDANMDGKITSSDLNEMSIIYSSTSTSVSVSLPFGQIIEVPTTYTGNWVHITMTITDLISGGTMKITEQDLVTGINRIIASNVSVNASGSSDYTNPDNWNMIFTHIEGAVGLIDNIKIERNPSFCEVEITGDAVLCTNMPAIINANASVNLGSNYQTNNTVFPIPDGLSTGVGSPIEVENSTALASEIYSITINSLTHELVNDLKIVLIAPNGSEIILVSYAGMGANSFIGTTFKMGAVQNIYSGTAPFTGEYSPEQSFYTLTGSAQGIWILKVIDENPGAAGTINSWSLNIPGENSIVNYSWSTGQSGSDLSQVSITPVAASSAYVTVTDLNGNISSAQFDYTVIQSPDVTVSGTANICDNENAVLTANVIAYGPTGTGDLVVSNSNPTEIPDDYFAGVNSQIVVANSGAMANELLSVTINSISHTNVSDLSLFLTAPNGSWITLAANIGGSGDNYTETEFTASASNFAQYGTVPFTGQFLPVDMIGSFTGSAQGTWTLKVVDNSPGETGTLLGWTLKLPNFNSIVDYTWSNGANGPNVNEITPSPSSNTSYTVVALDANGCEGTGGFDVIVNPAPYVGIIADNVICYGESTVLFTETSFDVTTPISVSTTNTTAYSIPDNNDFGITSPIDVVHSDLNASDISSVVINSLTHTFVADLIITLIAPDGSSIVLFQNPVNNGENFVETEFTMSAPNPIYFGSAPFTGQFAPVESFTNLTGPAQGIWNLKVVDNSMMDNGTLNAWTINLLEVNTLTNYAWSSGETGLSYYNLSVVPYVSTTYTVTVTDLRGCVASEMIDVTVNIPSEVVITQGLGTLNSDADFGNQWYEETIGLLDGETDNILTPLVDGTYYCVVTDINDCVATSNSIDFVYSEIANLNMNAIVSVFPNPNNGIFKLEINADSNQSMQMQLVNIQGQIVYSNQIEVDSKYSQNFDFSDLAPGIYSLQLMNENFNKISKIVIQ